jgi:hypothetical protein
MKIITKILRFLTMNDADCEALEAAEAKRARRRHRR